MEVLQNITLHNFFFQKKKKKKTSERRPVMSKTVSSDQDTIINKPLSLQKLNIWLTSLN